MRIVALMTLISAAFWQWMLASAQMTAFRRLQSWSSLRLRPDFSSIRAAMMTALPSINAVACFCFDQRC